MAKKTTRKTQKAAVKKPISGKRREMLAERKRAFGKSVKAKGAGIKKTAAKPKPAVKKPKPAGVTTSRSSGKASNTANKPSLGVKACHTDNAIKDTSAPESGKLMTDVEPATEITSPVAPVDAGKEYDAAAAEAQREDAGAVSPGAQAPDPFVPHGTVIGSSEPSEDAESAPLSLYRVEYEVVPGNRRTMMLDATDTASAMEEAADFLGIPKEELIYEDE